MNDEMMRALEADGEKLRALTGEDHGPVFLKTGAVLSFIGGLLEIPTDSGLCRLSISDDDLDYAEGGYRTLNLLPSEAMAIRDFLNKHIPAKWDDAEQKTDR